jgi:hypothetical protein
VQPLGRRARHGGAGVTARLLALVLRVDVAPRARGTDDGLGLDLDQQLRTHQRGHAEQGGDRPHLAQGLDEGPRVIGGLAEIGEEGLVYTVARLAPARPARGGSFPWSRASAGTCRRALDAAGRARSSPR